jgi:GT2 family glycosyltransferase
MEPPNYSTVIVTFRRPEALATALAALAAQTRPPAMVVVADNDPEGSAEATVAAAGGSAFRVQYLPMGANLGPAGGWARAAAWAQQQGDRGEWLLVGDDDDPLADPLTMAGMLAAATQQPPDVAAIGLMGATFNRRSAVLHRVRAAPAATAPCDYLASGGITLYRWDVIDEQGFFDEALFFGFEDLDYGLRLRSAGLRLCVVAPIVGHTVQPSAPARVAWREYFKTRALVTVCRRHVGAWAVTITVARSLAGGARIAIENRRPALAVARWRGVVDALRGRLGADRYAPTNNPAKPK